MAIKNELILDALRWDWSEKAKANYYPPVIHVETDRELLNIKNKIQRFFYPNKKKHVLNIKLQDTL